MEKTFSYGCSRITVSIDSKSNNVEIWDDVCDPTIDHTFGPMLDIPFDTWYEITSWVKSKLGSEFIRKEKYGQ